MIARIITLVALVVLLPSAAFAASGTVTGQMFMQLSQGQSCDTSTMDCTAARFPSTINNTYQPVRDAIVHIADSATGAVIGESSTDANGNFSIVWNKSTVPADVHVRWVYWHKDNRFRVCPTSNPNSAWHSPSWNIDVTNGSTVPMGGIYYSDNEVMQAYEGAHRMWRDALSYSGLALTKFVGVALRSPDTDTAAGRASADQTLKIVRLGPGSARYPISDVHHEIGHVMHGQASAGFKMMVAYNHPTVCTNGNCSGDGHGLDTAEWHSNSFTEALGSHLGLVASYWYWAPEPIYCLNALGPCGSEPWYNQYDIEATSGDSCATDEGRWELSHQRAMWDIYDSVQDAVFSDTTGANTSSTYSYMNMVNVLGNYATGIGNGQVNECWSNTGLTQTNSTSLDQRALSDYRTKIGGSTYGIKAANCFPQ